jgi:hypothetical protein
MTHHHPDHEQERTGDEAARRQERNPEAPDPPGNPADQTSPRTKQEPDPERVKRGTEEFDRTIAS